MPTGAITLMPNEVSSVVALTPLDLSAGPGNALAIVSGSSGPAFLQFGIGAAGLTARPDLTGARCFDVPAGAIRMLTATELAALAGCTHVAALVPSRGNIRLTAVVNSNHPQSTAGQGI